jgi:hypothetical protein
LDKVYPQNGRKEGIERHKKQLSVKKPGHTDEGLAAAAASLTAAERRWSCSSSSFRLFASICLCRCSSYATATGTATASAISLLSCLFPTWIDISISLSSFGEESRREKRRGFYTWVVKKVCNYTLPLKKLSFY